MVLIGGQSAGFISLFQFGFRVLKAFRSKAFSSYFGLSLWEKR